MEEQIRNILKEIGTFAIFGDSRWGEIELEFMIFDHLGNFDYIYMTESEFKINSITRKKLNEIYSIWISNGSNDFCYVDYLYLGM